MTWALTPTKRLPVALSDVLRIGTRGSPLALAQTRQTRDLLTGLGHAVEIVVIKTSGDLIQDRALAEAGGKGLFTKEIDAAMLRGEIDLAVHSAKDLPTWLEEGVSLAGFLPREDARDALISAKAATIASLPHEATMGTASLRRQAQVLRLRPDLKVSLLRGNVETRLRKAERGEIDATLLAVAGLKRLGLLHRAVAVLETDQFLPAVGQGAIGLTARADAATLAALAPILDRGTGDAVVCERAFLAALEGSCKTPIAGHAWRSGETLQFKGAVYRVDGSETFEVAAEGSPSTAEEIGSAAGQEMLAKIPKGLLAH